MPQPAAGTRLWESEPAQPGARRVTSALYSVLGGAAFALGVLAIITGSLTPLSLLAGDMVGMWAIATMRHAHAPPGRPIAT